MTLRTSLALAASLSLTAACGGDKDEAGDDCASITLEVSVVDTLGVAVDDADVNIDNNIICSGAGAGAYTCDLPGSGEYNLYVLKVPDYESWGLQILADCAVNPMGMDVVLENEGGGL